MTQLAELGETEQAIEAGLRILRLEPLHEVTVRRLMRLYGESGRRGTAVDLYRTLADALRKELGAQPESETRAVLRRSLVAARSGHRLQRSRMPCPRFTRRISVPISVHLPPWGEGGPKDRKADADSTRSGRALEQRVAPVISAPRQAKTRKRSWIARGRPRRSDRDSSLHTVRPFDRSETDSWARHRRGCHPDQRHCSRRASLCKSVQRSGTGVLLRWLDGGNHLRARQGAGPERGRPHLGLRVQGPEPQHPDDRRAARRVASHRRVGAQGRQPRAHHGAAHQGR